MKRFVRPVLGHQEIDVLLVKTAMAGPETGALIIRPAKASCLTLQCFEGSVVALDGRLGAPFGPQDSSQCREAFGFAPG